MQLQYTIGQNTGNPIIMRNRLYQLSYLRTKRDSTLATASRCLARHPISRMASGAAENRDERISMDMALLSDELSAGMRPVKWTVVRVPVPVHLGSNRSCRYWTGICASDPSTQAALSRTVAIPAGVPSGSRKSTR